VVEKICQVCHGLYGQATGAGSSVLSPNITAQQKDYLIAKLRSYKSGKIQHHQMNIIASMLSDEDIQNVAEWYSSIEIEITLPEID
jgi:cytochrome c553